MKSKFRKSITKEKIKIIVGFRVIHNNQKIVVVLKIGGKWENNTTLEGEKQKSLS